MKILGYFLMVASVLIPTIGVWVFIATNRLSTPQQFVGLTMVALFIFVTVATIGLIVLAAIKAIQLDSGFLKWLGGATVAEVAGICTIIVKAYFGDHK
ncbi:hypothetical protein JAO29_13705 [Edaphobacter sp. HDX4]|uniref:hypothetical protein n=1 Tax=Edaphobacter sp. HDX4 TaxID=2794064 RepID=UPI002FE5CF44